MSKVTITALTKSFGQVEVLKRIDDEFQDGEFITLLGPSGCGKTTMLRMIAGFEKPTTGEIRLDDELVNGPNCFVPPERRGIGMVFQSYAVWPHMNVFDNIAYPLKLQKVAKAEIKDRVNAILNIVHLAPFSDRMPSQLSGGQQQRVALGRALVSKPRLLLLDEPLSNLDAKLRESMRYEIKEIQRQLGITVIFVTHDQVEAMTMSDRVIILNRGIVQQSGKPREIYEKPANQFVADFIGKVNFLKGIASAGQIKLNAMATTLPYTGSLRGKVVLAFRPENAIPVTAASATGEAELEGTVEKLYFLGNESDCFVQVGSELIRTSFPSGVYEPPTVGGKLKLKLREPLVFPDDEGEDSTKILT